MLPVCVNRYVIDFDKAYKIPGRPHHLHSIKQTVQLCNQFYFFKADSSSVCVNNNNNFIFIAPLKTESLQSASQKVMKERYFIKMQVD